MKDYLTSVIKQFEYYRQLGEKTFDQLSDEKLLWQPNAQSNNIATIVKHLSGNMQSRFTDFLTSDGEKEWRDRDYEFEQEMLTRHQLLALWNKGWSVFLEALTSLQETDLEKIVYIRNQGHTVMEAVNRQLAHYPYHIGQIVFIGKLAAAAWESLSIPKGGSKDFNQKTFAPGKRREHFTDSLKKDDGE